MTSKIDSPLSSYSTRRSCDELRHLVARDLTTLIHQLVEFPRKRRN